MEVLGKFRKFRKPHFYIMGMFLILLMVQKSCVHQLRLIVKSDYLRRVNDTSQVNISNLQNTLGLAKEIRYITWVIHTLQSSKSHYLQDFFHQQ